MTIFREMDSAPRNGTPVLLRYSIKSNDVLGYAPWDQISVVIGWWESDDSWTHPWKICFMDEGAADSYGGKHTHFQDVPEHDLGGWAPLPE